MARARAELGGLGRAAGRLSRRLLAELAADEVQGRLQAQARPGLEPGDEVLEARAVRALDVAGDLAAVTGGEDAALGELHEAGAAQRGERAVHVRGAQVDELVEILAVDRGERAGERAQHAGVLDREPVLLQAGGGVLRRAVEEVLEHFGQVGGEAGVPGLRVGGGGERRHGPHLTVRT